MLIGQMSLWQLTSVKGGPRNLTLKFGHNRVSNSWDIANIICLIKVYYYVIDENALQLLTPPKNIQFSQFKGKIIMEGNKNWWNNIDPCISLLEICIQENSDSEISTQ